MQFENKIFVERPSDERCDKIIRLWALEQYDLNLYEVELRGLAEETAGPSWNETLYTASQADTKTYKGATRRQVGQDAAGNKVFEKALSGFFETARASGSTRGAGKSKMPTCQRGSNLRLLQRQHTAFGSQVCSWKANRRLPLQVKYLSLHTTQAEVSAIFVLTDDVMKKLIRKARDIARDIIQPDAV